jgi:hypothetical protein
MDRMTDLETSPSLLERGHWRWIYQSSCIYAILDKMMYEDVGLQREQTNVWGQRSGLLRCHQFWACLCIWQNRCATVWHRKSRRVWLRQPRSDTNLQQMSVYLFNTLHLTLIKMNHLIHPCGANHYVFLTGLLDPYKLVQILPSCLHLLCALCQLKHRHSKSFLTVLTLAHIKSHCHPVSDVVWPGTSCDKILLTSGIIAFKGSRHDLLMCNLLQSYCMMKHFFCQSSNLTHILFSVSHLSLATRW